jgi:tetratricopeptide (TPR) repeat protein
MLRYVTALFFCVSLLRAETVLVLPFFNQSNSANLDWIGESIAEYVREALASEDLLVLDREDRLEAFRRLSVRPNALITRATVIKVGQALDASKVIYGQYELTPPAEGASAPAPAAGAAPASRGSLHITARIMDLDHLRQGPEYAEIGSLEDIALLETRLGWQTLQFLTPKTAPSEQEFLDARPAVRVDAVENYVRGLLSPGAEQKHRFFTQAARLDERFSQPCYQLGKIYWQKKDYRVASGWLNRVRRSDSHYLEARFYLGLCKYHGGDFAGAAECFEQVARTVPLNEVWNDLGAAQSRQNLPDAAESFKKALEGDDADPDYHFNLGYALWKAGQFDAATESFRAVLERNPNDTEATTYLGRALKKDGPRPAEAKSGGRERIKTNYEETAYRQLKAELQGKAK